MSGHERELPTVSVIVPVYNDLERLRLCLERLADQDYSGSLDVIVVDNASTMDLAAALPPRDPRFRLIREERKGSYAARNAGLAIAESDIVAFTDADCRPHPDWISTAVARLTATDSPDAIGGTINLVFRDGGSPKTGPELYEAAHDFDQRSYIEQNCFAATANLVVSRSALDLVGRFDDRLKSGGDDDWGHRLHAVGGTLHFSGETIVDHPSRPTWADLTTKSVRVARGLADLTADQPFRSDLAHYGDELVLMFRAFRRTWGRRSRMPIGARARYSGAYLWVTMINFGVRVQGRWESAWRRLASMGLNRRAQPNISSEYR